MDFLEDAQTIFFVGRIIFGIIGILSLARGIKLISKCTRTIPNSESYRETEEKGFDLQLGVGKIILGIALLLLVIYLIWFISLPLILAGYSIQLIYSPHVTYSRRVAPLFARKEDIILNLPTLEIIKERKKRILRNILISLAIGAIASIIVLTISPEIMNRPLPELLSTLLVPLLCFSSLFFAAALRGIQRMQHKGNL